MFLRVLSVRVRSREKEFAGPFFSERPGKIQTCADKKYWACKTSPSFETCPVVLLQYFTLIEGQQNMSQHVLFDIAKKHKFHFFNIACFSYIVEAAFEAARSSTICYQEETSQQIGFFSQASLCSTREGDAIFSDTL